MKNRQTVIINHKRTLFYCWSWDRWCSVRQLGKGGHEGGCFARGCRRMYEPVLPHLRQAEVRRIAAGVRF
jgi:hypothetical protein